MPQIDAPLTGHIILAIINSAQLLAIIMLVWRGGRWTGRIESRVEQNINNVALNREAIEHLEDRLIDCIKNGMFSGGKR